jgi:DNA-directed RNA polymerase subunit M/transcription elongation factor TFIIS
MEFCEICDNMLYVKSNAQNMLVKYCKHCEFEKVETNTKCAIKISKTIYSEDDLLYNQHVNKYLRFDPTLRRINDPHISCANETCVQENANKQIIYIKYDSKNMKYLYVCENCGKTWKQLNPS